VLASGHKLAYRFSFQLEAHRVPHQMVQERIDLSGLSFKVLIPGLGGELRGEDGAASTGPLVGDVKELAVAGRGDGDGIWY